MGGGISVANSTPLKIKFNAHSGPVVERCPVKENELGSMCRVTWARYSVKRNPPMTMTAAASNRTHLYRPLAKNNNAVPLNKKPNTALNSAR